MFALEINVLQWVRKSVPKVLPRLPASPCNCSVSFAHNSSIDSSVSLQTKNIHITISFGRAPIDSKISVALESIDKRFV